MRRADHVRWSTRAATGGMSFGKLFFLAPDGTPRSESAYGVRFLFTGREYLVQVGLYDYRHRAYTPTLGRFLQVDPIDFTGGDFNLYRYCANRVSARIDPHGLCERIAEEYVEHYVNVLKENWTLNPGKLATLARRPDLDITIYRWDESFRWGGRILRSDEMGNAGAAFALAENFGLPTAWLMTRIAEGRFAGFRGRWWATPEAKGSFRDNDFGFRQWLSSPSGREAIRSWEFIANNY